MSVAAPLHNNGAMAPASSSNLGPAVNGAVAASSNNKAAAAPSEVGWLFVTQYYTSLNNDPEKLHCYYSKRSTFLHGTEQDESAPVCFGQQVSEKGRDGRAIEIQCIPRHASINTDASRALPIVPLSYSKFTSASPRSASRTQRCLCPTLTRRHQRTAASSSRFSAK